MSWFDLSNKLKIAVGCKQCKVNVKLWTKEAHTRRKPYTFLVNKLHALLESKVAFIVFMSINEARRWWLVDLSNCWHSNPILSKYSECEVTRSQECWCNWKTTERLIRFRNLRNLNTEPSSDCTYSHFVISCSPHLAIENHIHKHVTILF